MAGSPCVLDTQHEDTVNDVQFDYSGRRLATCSSDTTIRIFAAEGQPPARLAELRGHTGPVWRVAWAHPKFGSILASCSFDKRVLIWREIQANSWQIIYEYSGHVKSVSSVCWAPVEYGLELACSSTDGYISILAFNKDTWTPTKFPAHNAGVTSVSWAPALPPTALLSEASPTAVPPKQLVSGGCDNLVIHWRTWEKAKVLDEHKDWVRDVAFADSLGVSLTFASCSQDGVVIVWTQNGGSWNAHALDKFPEPVWHVSWSITGNILAVSSGTNKVTLWKESLEGVWQRIDDFVDQPQVPQALSPPPQQ